MDFIVRFESAVFAMEGALGVAFVAQEKIVHFDLFGRPGGDGVAAGGEHEVVIFTDGTQAIPFGLRGAENEIPFEGGIAGLIALEPGVVEDFPAFVGFDGGQDESASTGPVAQGVQGRSTAACRAGRTAPATVTLFGWVLIRRQIFFVDVVWRRGGRVVVDCLFCCYRKTCET